MMTKPLLIDEIDPKIDNFEIEQIIAKYPEMPVFIGRQRAEEALNFGLDIKDGGYHIFALGPSGIGKSSTILRLLKERSGREQAPSDWCYVNNFKEAEKPIALELPAGCGRFFKDRMNEFINELRSLVPRIFESDEYVRRLNSIAKEEEFRKKETIQSFAEMAKSLNYEVNQTPFGIVLTAIRNGRPLTDLQVEELPSELRSAYEQNRNELLDEATLINRQVRKIEREGNERREKMNKEILHSAIDPYIAELRERFQNFEPVLTFIESVKGDIIENANEIKGALEEKSAQNILEQTLFADSEKLSIFNKYSVNLFVGDGNKGAPIVLESLPTVPHLVGRFEFRSRLGGVTTDFTMLRPGALQSANGGYLILDAIELLTQPFSWSVLKNTIQSGEIRLEEIGERLPFSVPTPTLRPEPIPLRAKIILVGPPMVYYLLTLYDKDFLELFRVKADFDTETEFRGEDRDKFIAFIYHFAKSELKTNISKQGIAEIIREASRLREHQTRVTLDYRQLTDILKEASFWSKDHGHEIDASDIQKAVDKKIFRSNLIEEKIQQYIEEGTIYVDTSGEKVGTVNGLSVIQLGDYEFGKPTRITSRTYAGRDGVVDIQRQSQLSGPIHGKAVMILANYLGGRFAQEIPLVFNATLTFEQEYGTVEGDSATVAEIVALVSSLTGLPVRQDLAVTGSANQHGAIQPIGGVNQKIEGFYSVCRAFGLTGSQGVIIPKSNQKNLVLRNQVLESIKEDQFKIFTVETVDQALELLLQRDIKEIEERAHEQLEKYAQSWRKFAVHVEKSKEIET